MYGTLQVRSFLGIDRADIEIADGITLLAGPNNVGKSSILEALIAIVKADTVPLGLDKKDVGELLHLGSKEASMTLTTRSGRRQVSLPECQLKTFEGKVTSVSALATGHQKYADLKFEDRAALLIARLGAEVTTKRLEEELKEIERMDQADVDEILVTAVGTDELPGKGFKAAETLCDTQATNKKREFKNIAGVGWGTKQGFDFTPPGWEPDLADAKKEDLQKAVVTAREALEAAIANNAISEDKQLELMALVETKPDHEKQLDEYRTQVSAFDNSWEEIKDDYNNAMANKDSLQCPGCDIHLQLTTFQGKKLLKPLEDQLGWDGDAVAELETKKANIDAGKSTAFAAFQKHERVLKEIADAEKKLKDTEGKDGNGEAVEAARVALTKADMRLKAFEAKEKGVELHYQIKGLLKAAEILSPKGLQKTMLMGALEAFNEQMADLCRTAGWSRVEIDENLIVRYGGRHYRIVSGSEQYRCDVTIQVALAKAAGESLLCFDESETLMNAELRSGFFGMLRTTGIPSVVVMAMKTKNGEVTEKIPDLRALGIGITYWVANKTVAEYKEAVPA